MVVPLVETTPAVTPGAARDAARAAAWQATQRAAVVVFAYALLAVALTWPLARHINDGVTSAVDPVDSIWRIGWGQRQLLNDPRRLFDGNTFYPFAQSYLFDEFVLGAAVLTLPLAMLAVPPLVIYNLAVLVTLVLSGVAMYALARRFGAAPVAAFLAGAIYAFAPMHLARIGHIGLLSYQWFPLILLLLDRIIERPRPRDAALLAGCLVMQAISSQYYAFYLAIIVPLFLAVMLVRRPEARRWRVWGHLVAAGAVALAIVLPVFLAYRGVQIRYGVERTYGQTTYYSAALSNFLTADGRNLLWGSLTAPLRQFGTYTFERNMFPGLAALALAGAGLWVARRSAWAQFFAALAIVGTVLALGPELRLTPETKSLLLRRLPYDLLYWRLPGMDSMRVPARFGALTLLGIAGLAGFGATAALRRAARLRLPQPLRRPYAAIGASALLLLAVGVESLNRPLPIVPLESGDAIPAEYRWLATQPDARVVELPLAVPDHASEQQAAVRAQYFSLVSGQRLVNGNANVIPKGYKALVLEMKRFPTERSVTILQGLGVTHVVVRFDQYPEAERDALARRLAAETDGVTPAATFGAVTIYRIAPSARLGELRAAIPPGASIRLSRADPLGTGAYMAMLGTLFPANPVYARLRVDFGNTYAGEPNPNTRYDYTMIFRDEEALYPGIERAPLVWEDSTARVFKTRP